MKKFTLFGSSAVGDAFQEHFGGFGFDFISDAGAHVPADATKVYTKIRVIATTIIAALATTIDAPINGAGDITGDSLAVGTELLGRFTSITLTSGSIVAYLGNK